MEYISNNEKNIVVNNALSIIKNVELKNGRLKQLFENNIKFLKKFDVNRMMYWFRVASGKPSPGAPYAFGDGHFENNLFGQTAGMFLMSAGTALLWDEDKELREKLNIIVDELEEFIFEDGCLLPIKKENRFTLEYPNYVRAWLTFGLLAAGYAGNDKAFKLARKFGDWFNNCEELSFVKDMNLGFQGILVNTELYLSPVGNEKDLEVAQKFYREDWWLDQFLNKDQTAIYRHPNHPHGTVLTAVEGYFDIFRITGEEKLFECVKNCLQMIEDKWQHIGGGIVMCEDAGDPQYPGCNFVSQKHSYNELCCSTFWILLNQRMALLNPENAHYYDEIEDSIYNMLTAAQVDDIGYHYNGYLEGCKDVRYTDVATCCAATGSRLVSMLPQFLYSYNEDSVFVNLFASSSAQIDGCEIEINTDMPYNGKVHITIKKWNKKHLKIRIPSWAKSSMTICGVTAKPGNYLTIDNLSDNIDISFELEFGIKAQKYTGADIDPLNDRYAFKYGPLLLAALRSKDVYIDCDTDNVVLSKINNNRYRINNNSIEFMPYMDIKDEPFNVYPYINN